MNRLSCRTLLLALVLGIWLGSLLPVVCLGNDEEGCVICHKYPGLARIDQQTGQLRLFYVDGHQYNNSVHGKVLCRNCHVKLDVIPHADFAKVNCSTKCHLKEPSTDREFSHGEIYQELNLSVHGVGSDEKPKKFSEDMPSCTDCHLNSVLQPVTGVLDQEAGVSADALRRCIGCHSEKEWANRYYQHFTHRLHRSKTSLETVKLCLACHKKADKMARHGLVVTDNYRDTYHWKGVLYGDANAPDCLSCHAPVGYTIHSMKSGRGAQSPVHANNLQQTCMNQNGTQTCHPNAIASFSSGKIHKQDMRLEQTLISLTEGNPPQAGSDDFRNGSSFISLMTDTEAQDSQSLNTQDMFHWKILKIVKYVYTLLITVVVGGMLLHQVLDFYRAIKNDSNNEGTR